MKIACVLLVAAAAAAAHTARAQDDVYLKRARAVLASTPLVDGHNDLPWRIREDKPHPMDVEAYDLRTHVAGMTDFARLKQGMLGAQFWSVYIPGEIKDSGFARVQLEQIDIARRVIAKYPDRLAWALTADEVRRVFKTGKIGSLLGLEGGHAIENSLGALREYYDMGARYMTLTHNVTLDWADAALDSAKHGGLTPFGKEVVREMNRVGMLLDLSHVSPGTMSNALDVTEAPVIFSHSGARALVDHPRNVPDSILKRVPKNGGVVMVPFVTSFVSKDVYAWDLESARRIAELRRRNPTDTAAARRDYDAWHQAHPTPTANLTQVADVIDYVRKVAGVDHVGIGSDFDGITDVVVGLEDVSKFPFLFAELARRGWTDADLRKLAGENVLRVLKRAEQVSARLKKERPASIRTIKELDGALPQRP
ncbi:MAG: dipeptidase [Gemmatimonadota bacterium]|nr:dipeptidase [Gemmatimonadota bacterium]